MNGGAYLWLFIVSLLATFAFFGIAGGVWDMSLGLKVWQRVALTVLCLAASFGCACVASWAGNAIKPHYDLAKAEVPA